MPLEHAKKILWKATEILVLGEGELHERLHIVSQQLLPLQPEEMREDLRREFLSLKHDLQQVTDRDATALPPEISDNLTNRILGLYTEMHS